MLASARANCRDIQVASGDSCASLATKCQISGADFTEYNPQKNLCSTLKPKQWVCCSAGALPNHSPQPSSDGSCYVYAVKSGDGCFSIAGSFGIDQSVITENNKNTWGWAGCDRLQVGQVICLSKGTPPFPQPVEGTQCGPQVPGTEKPTDGTLFSKLNPCPLNSCCNIWGFCGITEDFCTPTPADTGAPGTAKPGTNGCISNCGTEINNNGQAPANFREVVYFEAWNGDRPCLKMDVTNIDTQSITDIHFAFATVSSRWQVVIDDKIQDQFTKFKSMTGVKKVLSFGGWAFSTDPGTFQRFRDATKPANRETFATNTVDFLNRNNLNGVDFDWEYPGATDIPGVTPGTKEEAENYLEFLKLIKAKMPSGNSVSIALPASYWYLKQYPVDKMQAYVDYFIYMTYDFYGQWDVGNEFTTPGCAGGNCLRSHVNKTETKTALSMITKAAAMGPCVATLEPRTLIPMLVTAPTLLVTSLTQNRAKSLTKRALIEASNDKSSDSNILIYGTSDEADWAAYMDKDTKKGRIDWIKGLNFGGSTDWAVDLQDFSNGGDDNPDDKCKKEDRTYRTETPKAGSYMDWYLMEPAYATTTSKQYITIVNLTPHRFKMDHTHSYQMDEFDFDDIPQGHARQNTAHYTERTGANSVDDNGEAYYSIEGTDRKFVIRATTHIPDAHPRRTVIDLSGMGMGQREYLDPEQESPVTLVITGSQDYGFITSIRHGPGNWMKGIYDVIKDRSIQHIVMPGTHDSGMSTISGKILSGGTAINTQTQGINIYDQLRAGARWFDLRVATIHNVPHNDDYSFWILHVNDENAAVAIGNSGESLDDVISEINKFTSESPGEVIFFCVRYLVGIRKVPSLGPIYWSEDMVNEFFGKLKGVNNRCLNLNLELPFNNRNASFFIDMNDGKGCVIFLLAGNLQKDVPQESIGDGIYQGNRMGKGFKDNWSNLPDTELLAERQVADWKTVDRSGSFSDDQFLISQWIISANTISTGMYGIESMAILPTNPALYWMGVNNMSPETWPNVLMVDYIGVVVTEQTSWNELSAELYTLAIGMNLYMISENCDISSRRSPLLPKPKGGIKALQASRLATPWNGIIYANGTVQNNPPMTLHPGRVKVFKSGTKFLNGTVLAKDVVNPDFNSTKI
ncbi:Killer toxin subunits alpha/beta [Tolypocladium ophioglossoides CBS 100239]|uniref:chitinase n=1 Tax=Tolypocladium ophioglossoides (strain CBS 100239) TaxID=1163406 RepID=A0A0L0MX15_TOLOC|nr:Killer toxin subunits alpha/beta [Tolypocladium ophioglossoides CBS 100239]